MIQCPNHKHLRTCYESGVNACLEGSSRSRKTYAGIDFLIDYCSHNERSVINIVRETYNSFKTTLYPDFAKRLGDFNIKNPFGYIKDISQYNLFGNQINFLGADNANRFLGAGSDLFWINEGLDVSKQIFDQLEQRCRKFWWIDYNPKCTDHYVFDLEKRPDVKFLRTTFKDNPWISAPERKKILSYEPTPYNIKHGTADEYMWKVYGCGERASLTGLIYPNVTWIDDNEWPVDVDWTGYGMDFGHTISPTAIVKGAAIGRNLFLKGLFYAPCDNPQTLQQILEPILGDDGHIWADSAERLLIDKLRSQGLIVIPAPKPAGSVNDGIDIMKSFKIHIVRDVDFKKETDNYKWREVGGITLNEPVKGHDHYLDGSRYMVVNESFRNG
jgi:phage terminase large subunit